MAWTNSKIFRQSVADMLGNVAALDFDTNTIKAALYDGTITPAQDVIASAAAYGGGVWSTTGGATGTPQVFHTGQWEQGGTALAGKSIDVGTAATVFLDATDTASGSAATMSNINGCLVYDDVTSTPVAKQAFCYNYFGGSNSVTNGTFTIQWNASGILRFTL